MVSLALALALAAFASHASTADEKAPAWVEPMREVHGRFTGEAGTLALFGDSITISLSKNGFALRNYLTLMRYAEVIEQALSHEKPGARM